MANRHQTSQGGVGFLGLLALLFIALKLTGVIAWSWWWVLAPLWVPLVVVAGIGLFILVVWGIIVLFTVAVDRR